MTTRVTLFLCAALAACGSSGPTGDMPPDAAEAHAPDAREADAMPVHTFMLKVPGSGESIGFSVEGTRVRVTQPPARLRMVRTSLAQTTNPGFLDGKTLPAKCA